MAIKRISYTQCDKCLRDTHHHPIQIVVSKMISQSFGPPRSVDLCETCAEAGNYYCRLCKRVHTDDNPCDAQLRKIESAEARA